MVVGNHLDMGEGETKGVAEELMIGLIYCNDCPIFVEMGKQFLDGG